MSELTRYYLSTSEVTGLVTHQDMPWETLEYKVQYKPNVSSNYSTGDPTGKFTVLTQITRYQYIVGLCPIFFD